MNKLQMRQTLEVVLGYYVYGKDASGQWTRVPSQNPPGLFYRKGEPIGPAFFMEGSERIQRNWDVKGLQCIMPENPVPRTNRTTGGLLEHWQTWQLRLRQFDTSLTIHPALSALARHFGGDCQITYVRDEDGLVPDRASASVTTKDVDLPIYSHDSDTGFVPSLIDSSPFKTFFDQ